MKQSPKCNEFFEMIGKVDLDQVRFGTKSMNQCDITRETLVRCQILRELVDHPEQLKTIG